MKNYKHLLGRQVNTNSGLARIESVIGNLATLSYSVGGIGWLDLTTKFELVEE